MKPPRDPDVPIDPSWATRVKIVDKSDRELLIKQISRSMYYLACTRCVWHTFTWLVLDGHAEGSGELLTLVSPDYALIAEFVLPSECRWGKDR